MNIFEQTKAYENYIKNHIDNVIEAFNLYFIPLLQLDNLEGFDLDELKFNIMRCDKQIYKHDLSKWSGEEFDAYRKKFYPTDEEEKDKTFKFLVEKEFEKAWEHHYKNNGHHPKHWNREEPVVDMPLVYIIEMMCDWFAMSKHFGTDCYNWWTNEAVDERAVMTDKTINTIEELFKIIYKIIL